MFNKILSSIVGKIGSDIGKNLGLGGGIFSRLGQIAIRLFSDYISTTDTPETYFKYKGELDSIAFYSRAYDKVIPIVLGTAVARGEIIWASPIIRKSQIKVVERLSRDASYVKSRTNLEEFSYYATFAVAICQGQISSIDRIWYGDQVIDLRSYRYTLYLGDEEQMPDQNIINQHGIDNTPAFRGLAYIVFTELPLADFNNQIPILSFEVLRRAVSPSISTEEMIQSIVMIPGSGEFVYDTRIVYKKQQYDHLPDVAVNSHNTSSIANSLYSLNQLQFICPNIEWIAVAVCWFGNSRNAGECIVLPAVEYKNLTLSEDWQVGKYTRETAHCISLNESGFINYGGTISDQSLLRYLDELKARGLKIVLYPLLLLDLPRKPWRGHLCGSAQEISNFFNRQDGGYNDFIIHYAQLAKNKVDAFIIGSEFKNLTKVREADVFPATVELVKLAAQVRKILTRTVKISYAADWSEYHRVEGSWYSLDALWASDDIDFIGIDAYFPLAHSLTSHITEQEITLGWDRGEGYEYYFDDKGHKHALTPEYAWKNITHWWQNQHFNPDGQATAWLPRMKKIWFTEFGFPSVDKAPNQPNVFYDPLCSDGQIPKFSNGMIDFSIQRRAISATLKRWHNSEMIERLFLWCWDARPYPAWPHGNIWQDQYLWSRGHWVNGKLGAVTVAAIIAEAAQRANIDISKLQLEQLDQPVGGIIIDYENRVSDLISLLRCAYFFDLCSEQDCIVFSKRATTQSIQIDAREIIPLSQNCYLLSETTSETLSKVAIDFISRERGYTHSTSTSHLHYTDSSHIRTLHTSLIMSETEAQNIADMILSNARSEHTIINFTLSRSYLQLRPLDLVSLIPYHDLPSYLLRIIGIEWLDDRIKILAVNEKTANYLLQPQYKIVEQDQQHSAPELLVWTISGEPYLYEACVATAAQSFYIGIDEDHTRLQKVNDLAGDSIVGYLENFTLSELASNLLTDELSKFIVYTNKPLPQTDTEVLDANIPSIMIGQEIVSYRRCQPIADGLSVLTGLIRGERFTEQFINSHAKGERCILMSQGVEKLRIDPSFYTVPLYYSLTRNDSASLKSIQINPSIPTVIFGGSHFKPAGLFLYWFPRESRGDQDYWTGPVQQGLYHIVKVTYKGISTVYRTEESQLVIPDIKEELHTIQVTITTQLGDLSSVPVVIMI